MREVQCCDLIWGSHDPERKVTTAIWCIHYGVHDQCTAKCIVEGALVHDSPGASRKDQCFIGVVSVVTCIEIASIPDTLVAEKEKHMALLTEFDDHRSSVSAHF